VRDHQGGSAVAGGNHGEGHVPATAAKEQRRQPLLPLPCPVIHALDRPEQTHRPGNPLLTVAPFFLCAGELKEEDDGGRDAVATDLARERLKSMREVSLRLLGRESTGDRSSETNLAAKRARPRSRLSERRKTMALQAAFILIRSSLVASTSCLLDFCYPSLDRRVAHFNFYRH
jgi:hypothetical protein